MHYFKTEVLFQNLYIVVPSWQMGLAATLPGSFREEVKAEQNSSGVLFYHIYKQTIGWKIVVRGIGIVVLCKDFLIVWMCFLRRHRKHYQFHFSGIKFTFFSQETCLISYFKPVVICNIKLQNNNFIITKLFTQLRKNSILLASRRDIGNMKNKVFEVEKWKLRLFSHNYITTTINHCQKHIICCFKTEFHIFTMEMVPITNPTRIPP